MGKKSEDRIAFEQLSTALDAVVSAAQSGLSPTVVRRIRSGLADHALAIEAVRAATDPVATPRASFDPSDPKIIGRMVAIALLAQPRVPLSSIKPTYGSGVYAIYYEGTHPLYVAISGTETPIYVGKADPSDHEASTPREQGPRLSGRLLEHAGTIGTAENHFTKVNPAGIHQIRLEDFTCRRLVCATNAQLAAENHLIGRFWPLWNSETKACWGMSKHGDAAKTRSNKRSPWDVVHPGRVWAMNEILVDSLTPAQIRERIDATLKRSPPRTDHAALLEEMLASFRQQDAPLESQTLIPPVGGHVTGPSDDEVGADDG